MVLPKPRLLAIMGSGETAPTMSKVHRSLLGRLGPPPVPAVVLDTPFGFQGNADDLASRAVEYFRESVQAGIAVASFRSSAETGSVGYETMLNRVREARYVFAGPGSPSYALSQWRGTQVPVVLADKLATGGCVTFASAAAATLGPFALPVYEVYKVGQAPHWLEGLDLMGAAGLQAVVIPHFDNAEGGTHDTRYCYMGEARLRLLEDMLADEVFVLGVDEHTACILDLDEQTATVAGRGRVTIRRRGRMAHLASGETVAIALLAGLADDGVGNSRGGADGSGGGGGRSQPGPVAAAGVALAPDGPVLGSIEVLRGRTIVLWPRAFSDGSAVPISAWRLVAGTADLVPQVAGSVGEGCALTWLSPTSAAAPVALRFEVTSDAFPGRVMIASLSVTVRSPALLQ